HRVEVRGIEHELEHVGRGALEAQVSELGIAIFHGRNTRAPGRAGTRQRNVRRMGTNSPSDSAPTQILEWIEHTTGGHVVHYERQPRWRPAWFIDVERDGEVLPLYFRGDRGALDHGVYSLEHEYRVLQVLEAHDIAVPHVYGF